MIKCICFGLSKPRVLGLNKEFHCVVGKGITILVFEGRGNSRRDIKAIGRSCLYRLRYVVNRDGDNHSHNSDGDKQSLGSGDFGFCPFHGLVDLLE